jgi:hypothetical protein
MRIAIATAAASLTLATMLPAQVAADAKIYAYPSAENYCPAGLQPITISGIICCGVPNQSMTYQQVMAHPKPKPRYARPAVKCPIGTKGCTYD